MPNTPMVAIFDTAFHQTIPPESFIYAILLGVTGEAGEAEAEFLAGNPGLDGVILYWQGLPDRALAQEARRRPRLGC